MKMEQTGARTVKSEQMLCVINLRLSIKGYKRTHQDAHSIGFVVDPTPFLRVFSHLAFLTLPWRT